MSFRPELDPYRLPWGGRYRLVLDEPVTSAFPGVRFVDGVSVEPVNARTARRIHQAYGRKCHIYEYTDEQQPAAPEPEQEPEQEVVPTTLTHDELQKMSRDELYKLAESLGMNPHWRLGAPKLRAMLLGDTEDND